MSGSLTLEYGNKKVTLDFGELELFNKADGTLDTAKFQTALQDKLKEQKITTSSGDQVSADTLIDVKVDSHGTVTLSDKKVLATTSTSAVPPEILKSGHFCRCRGHLQLYSEHYREGGEGRRHQSGIPLW